jgi:hypothetical protein
MIEAVREDEKSRRPQPDEDAKPFSVPLSVSRLTTCEEPDGNGADDGSKAENEAKFTEKFELSWFDHSTFNRLQ